MKLRTKFYLGTVTVFGVLALAVSGITIFLVNESVIELSARRVRLDMNSARLIFHSRQDRILYRAKFLGKEAETVEGPPDQSKFSSERLERMRRKLESVKAEKGYELDILNIVDPSGAVILRTGADSVETETLADPLLRQAVQKREAVSGVILLTEERLHAEDGNLLDKCLQNGGEPRAMFMGAAVPLVTGGEFWGVLEAGIVLNGATDKVDAIRDLVYEKKDYKGRPVGTATIFMGDLRISTNVLDAKGRRAIGTRVSPEVAERVLKNGLPWTGSALVVDTWYLAQYDPIRDPDGRIIGMLYVGALEQLYKDLRTQSVVLYLIAILGGMVLSIVVLVPISRGILGPIRRLSHATEKLAAGDLDHRVGIATNDEVGHLSQAFDRMAEQLEAQRRELEAKQTALETANEELRVLNKNYMELLGFVSHELKNPLSSAIMGLYSVKDGYLGTLHEPQKKALDSVGKSLEYFKEIIKSYLDLSRLEKGEINVHKGQVALYPTCVAPVVEGLERALESKRMVIKTRVPQGMTIDADGDLIRIVMDNLISNAIKYGREEGVVAVEASQRDGEHVVSVYNEGEGVARDKLSLLFKKFSRVYDPGAPVKKGTGLGLFICKEIIEKHGGRIWAESEEGRWMRFTFVLPARKP